MDELEYLLWLTYIPGLGTVKISNLLKKFGSPKNVWYALKSDLTGVKCITRRDIENIRNNELKYQYLDKAKKTIYNTMKKGIKILTLQSKDYPSRLKNIYDPPQILYVKGNLKCVYNDMIAIVGSRNASIYGRKVADKISYKLSKRGIITVSGMARGIDTCAHKGALKAGKETVAVLGCGVDICYPKENYKLMEYITKCGAIISEYAPGSHPEPSNFPARNRIISGLCLGTVVIEAGQRSGSLITADFALEQGREVFAVPGNVDSPYSKGTNNLIKQGAKLVSSIDDILEELQLENVSVSQDSGYEQTSVLNCENLSNEEKMIVVNLSSTPIHLDELCRKTQLSVHKISSILTVLEMRGLAIQIPGKYFVRN